MAGWDPRVCLLGWEAGVGLEGCLAGWSLGSQAVAALCSPLATWVVGVTGVLAGPWADLVPLLRARVQDWAGHSLNVSHKGLPRTCLLHPNPPAPYMVIESLNLISHPHSFDCPRKGSLAFILRSFARLWGYSDEQTEAFLPWKGFMAWSRRQTNPLCAVEGRNQELGGHRTAPDLVRVGRSHQEWSPWERSWGWGLQDELTVLSTQGLLGQDELTVLSTQGVLGSKFYTCIISFTPAATSAMLPPFYRQGHQGLQSFCKWPKATFFFFFLLNARAGDLKPGCLASGPAYVTTNHSRC